MTRQKRRKVRRRTRIDVVVDILGEALGGTVKTNLSYRCNLNFVRFNRYLTELLEAGLLEVIEDPNGNVLLYKTTKKGKDLLEVLKKAGHFLSL